MKTSINFKILVTIIIILPFVLSSILASKLNSTETRVDQIQSSQKALTKKINSLQSSINSTEATPNSTVKTTSNDVSIKTTVTTLDKAQSIIDSDINSWVDIQLGKGPTIFASAKGSGFDISQNIYSTGTYTINGKAYKAIRIVTLKYNSNAEWNLLKNSKSNEA